MRWLAAGRYRRQVDDWVEGIERRAELLERARMAFGGSYTWDGLRLEPGERLIGAVDVDLLELRSVRVTNWGSAAHRTSSGNTYRAGRAQSESHDELRTVDRGDLVVTDRRLLYLGRKTREVRWRRVVDHQLDMRRGTAVFRIGTRERPLMVSLHRKHRGDFPFVVEVALAAHDGVDESFLHEMVADLNSWRRDPPQLPADVDPDPRVLAELPSAPVAAIEAPRADHQPPELPPAERVALPRGQFLTTSPTRVAVAAQASGLRVTLATWTVGADEPTVTALPLRDGAKNADLAVSVVAGTEDQTLTWLLETKPEFSLVVCATPIEGLRVLDDDTDTAVTHIDAGDADDFEVQRRDDTTDVTRLSVTVAHGEAGLQLLGDMARVARSFSRKAQVLIVEGPAETLTEFETLVGFDEVVIAAIDIQVDDEPPDAELEPVAVRDAPTVVIAGRRCPHPAEVVRSYADDHARTIRQYDLAGWCGNAVTAELIAATRVIRSRISVEHERWFIERADSAPWHLVPLDARLADADPCVVDGLYDHAVELYNHFRAAAPKGVAAAKVYKVLHLTRPHLFPILDRRLQRFYDVAARAAAPVLNGCRPDQPPVKYAYWAAIRTDLLANAEPLAAIRAALAETGDPFLSEVSTELSDIRLLDVLAWASGDHTED